MLLVGAVSTNEMELVKLGDIESQVLKVNLGLNMIVRETLINFL